MKVNPAPNNRALCLVGVGDLHSGCTAPGCEFQELENWCGAFKIFFVVVAVFYFFAEGIYKSRFAEELATTMIKGLDLWGKVAEAK